MHALNIISHIKHVVLLLAVLMLTACATSKNEIIIDADDIVVSEEYGIDTEISNKFDQAVKLIAEKKFEKAIELLIEVTNETQKHSAPYINLAIAYSEIGNVQEAENTLLKAIKFNPRHPVTNNELALLYRKKGRFDEAKTIYEEIVKIYPQFLPARKNLGILCDLFMGDLDCAISHYEVFLKVQPNAKEVKIWLVDLKRRAGQ